MKEFNSYLKEFKEFGVITEIKEPIFIVEGLPYVKPNEVIITETGQKGLILSLQKYYVECLLLSNEAVIIGTKITRTGKTLSIGLSQDLLGNIINPLGENLQNNQQTPTNIEEREIDHAPPSISNRTQIKVPFLTGVSLVDLTMPLGKGQRELIVGDRKTGKTSFLLSVIKTQVAEGTKVVYGAIGKKSSEVKRLQQNLEKELSEKKVIIVASMANHSPSLIHLTPFSAMTVGEYLIDKGNDTLVILDDLSTHAQFYRELSLIAGKFPGRESYPGDIFYTHARLLERAGNYKSSTSETGPAVSLTCLPVAETQQNDLSDYIVSNLIGITDGHLLFDSDIFAKGRRPAINPFLSVTRVGRQTQSRLRQELSQELINFLSQYEQSLSFSHLGTELTETIRGSLNKGDEMYAFFNQELAEILPLPVQLVFMGMIVKDIFPAKSLSITKLRDNFLNQYKFLPEAKELITNIAESKTLEEFIKEIISKKEKLLQYTK